MLIFYFKYDIPYKSRADLNSKNEFVRPENRSANPSNRFVFDITNTKPRIFI